MITDTERTTITLAHSPDSDDAFMFYGLATNKIDTGGLHFQHLLKDIQTLNEEATRGTYDVTAISFHAYAYVADKYALLPHGASIGDNYGPIVVSRQPATPADIPRLKIAIPGKLTSAFLALRIFNSEFEYEVVPFDKIIDAVQDGRCDAGLLIHEGQLFYESKGLHKVLDLGEWWHSRHGLPLPDRKSTRLNSSHLVISYAVFCLKKKNTMLTVPEIEIPCGSNKSFAGSFAEQSPATSELLATRKNDYDSRQTAT